MKSYHQIPIQECGEPLVPIPLEQFAVESPHPYEKLGANYGGRSPYYLRQGVLNSLIKAQTQLQQHYSGWRIKIFDAYRPVEVQQFMVDYTFASVVQAQSLNSDKLSPEQHQSIWEQVYQIWAVPSDDPATPPPHSTGAAIDVTLVDANGETVDMGSEIDELSARSHPDYYANSISEEQQKYHARRQLLKEVMRAGGLCRHPGEWWHFSLGDQMWAWQYNQENPSNSLTARYGRVFEQNA
ncbi:MAG: M15 family metallopeptidase [Xenococcaceae cyanobacterium]